MNIHWKAAVGNTSRWRFVDWQDSNCSKYEELVSWCKMLEEHIVLEITGLRWPVSLSVEAIAVADSYPY
jgi:hypothetical protein